MTSELHFFALAWLRYGKRMPIVCTEVGQFNADVLGINTSMCIEVEVKKTKGDLLRDFSHKKQKHFLYNKGSSNSPFLPNYFYYLVPHHLADKASEIIKEKAPKAGLAVALEDNTKLGKNISVVIKAKKLHDQKPSFRLVQTALMRMSSELVGLHQSNFNAHNFLAKEVKKISSHSLTAALRMHGTLDSEKDLSLEREVWAMELAGCVEGITPENWAKLSQEQKDRWLDAIDKWRAAENVSPDFPESWFI